MMNDSYDTEEFAADDADREPGLTSSVTSRDSRRLDKSDASKGTILKAAIGREVRALRSGYGMTAIELAAASGISVSMLSKVENGIISPSLDTLNALACALGVPVTTLFRRYIGKSDAVLMKAGEGMNVDRRSSRAGHQYKLLGLIGSNSSGVVVEPYLITLNDPADKFPAFHHDGMEFLYILEGEFVYRHGDLLYPMRPGDSLFFDADTPHGPKELVNLPVRFLSVICYKADRTSG